ncbi:hypothetical protein CCHR01_00031 [Colletotrichum chrysophilum]|uniref:Secreted protein n=1 Tax=Colletotrichum chrysophilum TaxID=1836956 RepID=A0AAD9EQG0_9PEZI|nr:hypothetical protein CCHR01_00031 [Colletotrichum chrysophilum]
MLLPLLLFLLLLLLLLLLLSPGLRDKHKCQNDGIRYTAGKVAEHKAGSGGGGRLGSQTESPPRRMNPGQSSPWQVEGTRNTCIRLVATRAEESTPPRGARPGDDLSVHSGVPRPARWT